MIDNEIRIKSIKYRKYWSNYDEKVWVATVYDPNFNFDPDETYSEREYENSVSNPIREILDFRFIIDLTKY